MNHNINIYYIMLSIVLVFFFINTTPSKSILCADIGGTRIKAAILTPNITLDSLKNISVVTMPSEKWLCPYLPMLFSKNVPNNLISKINKFYDQISFGITGPVLYRSQYVNPYKKIPRQLKKECEKILDIPVTIENDTIIWAKGALYWHKLINRKIIFPCLGLTLGSGAGIVVMKSPNDLLLVEISFINEPFIKLYEASHEQIKSSKYGKIGPHKLMGKTFFDWIKKKHPYWNSKKIESLFNKKIVAFCNDIQFFIKCTLNINCRSIMIGGGNSRLISYNYIYNMLKKPILLLNPESIACHDVCPDIIPLLGCIYPSNCFSIKCIPTLQKIAQLKAYE